MKNTYEIRGDTAIIFLRKRDGTIREALIDVADLPLAQSHKGSWHESNGYVRGHIYLGRRGDRYVQETVLLHSLIMGKQAAGVDVDHRDRNPLNNRRQNLLVCSHQRNTMNRPMESRYAKSLSGMRGVSWHKRSRRWRARVVVGGKDMQIGSFRSPEPAAVRVREFWERKLLEVA